MAGPSDRRHPRFTAATQVEMRTEERSELRSLWTENISKGGLFVATDDPPQMRAVVDVSLVTPDGTIALRGEVVHVVDRQTAYKLGLPAGVGLQFTDLTPEVRNQIERYVDGLAAELQNDVSSGKPPSTTLDQLFEQARKCLAALDGSDLYGALELKPTASAEQIGARVDELVDLFGHPPSGTPPPKEARLNALVRQLERVRALLLDGGRRAEYHTRRGLPRPVSAGEEQAAQQALRPGNRGPDQPTTGKQAEVRNEMGLVMLRKGDFRGARDLFAEAMTLDPKTTAYRANYAWSYLADGRCDRQEALKQSRPLLEQAMKELTLENSKKRRVAAMVYYYYGRLLKEEGRAKEAMDSFKKATLLDEHHTDAARELRLLSAREGRPT